MGSKTRVTGSESEMMSATNNRDPGKKRGSIVGALEHVF